jgi:hypothetical protein
MVDNRPRGDGTSSSETIGLSISPERLQGIPTAHPYHQKTSMSVSPMNMAKYSSPKGVKRAGSVTGSPATNGLLIINFLFSCGLMFYSKINNTESNR